MPKYRRIPLVFEAKRITLDSIREVAEWCGSNNWLNPVHIIVKTNHGEAEAVVGDWIIQNPISGEFYPCDDKTFVSSYEEILPPPPKETFNDRLARLARGYSG